MTEPRAVGFCPHCGSRAPQRLVHTQRYKDVLFNMDGTIADSDVLCAYFVAVCEGCNQILLYHETDGVLGGPFTTLDLLYPESGRLDRSVPERIRAIYAEAYRSRYLAPSAFAVQIRRALEAITEERGVTKGSLAQRLSELGSDGSLPPVLADMGDVLRILGNLGAHAGADDVAPGHVGVINEFFKAVVEYLYVAPSNIADIKARLAKLKLPTP